MAKKPLTVTLRKPSLPSTSPPQSDTKAPSEEGADAFVDGGRAGFRRTVVYLPEALADRLALHCRSRDRDVSALVTEVIERHLAGMETAPRVERVEVDTDPMRLLVRWVEKTFPRVAAMRPAWF